MSPSNAGASIHGKNSALQPGHDSGDSNDCRPRFMIFSD